MKENSTTHVPDLEEAGRRIQAFDHCATMNLPLLKELRSFAHAAGRDDYGHKVPRYFVASPWEGEVLSNKEFHYDESHFTRAAWKLIVKHGLEATAGKLFHQPTFAKLVTAPPARV